MKGITIILSVVLLSWCKVVAFLSLSSSNQKCGVGVVASSYPPSTSASSSSSFSQRKKQFVSSVSFHTLNSKGGMLDEEEEMNNNSNVLLSSPPSNNNDNDEKIITDNNDDIIITSSLDDEKELSLEDSSSSRNNNKILVGGTFFGYLSLITIAAKTGLLPIADKSFVYTDALIAQDIGFTFVTAILGYVFVKVCTMLATTGKLQPRDSRKLIHTLSAPLFMVFWPLFTSEGGRYFAACVPLLNAFRLYIASKGESDEADLANAISRSGDAEEALGGPFIYTIILGSSLLLFWKDTIVGITVLCTMAAGDGMADIIGRRLGKGNPWPFVKGKSIAGSVAFVFFSSLAILLLTSWFNYTGCFTTATASLINNDIMALLPQIIGISTACAVIEILPLGDDNWTVPISSAILAKLFLN